MAEQSIRTLLRVHLSTAVILMIVAGILLYLNLGVATSVNIKRSKAHPDHGNYDATAWIGWPIRTIIHTERSSTRIEYVESNADKFWKRWKGRTVLSLKSECFTESYSSILENLAVNVFILFCVWFFVELYIREQEKVTTRNSIEIE